MLVEKERQNIYEKLAAYFFAIAEIDNPNPILLLINVNNNGIHKNMLPQMEL